MVLSCQEGIVGLKIPEGAEAQATGLIIGRPSWHPFSILFFSSFPKQICLES